MGFSRYFSHSDSSSHTSQKFSAPLRELTEDIAPTINKVVNYNYHQSEQNLRNALKLSPADHTEDSLFGVDEIIDDFAQHLKNQSGDWVLSLWGDGGIGKTTVVHEVLSRHALDAGFTHFAWVDVIPRVELYSQYSMIQLNEALSKAAYQLKLPSSPDDAHKIRDFANSIRALPENNRVLIVIDNLEGVKDPELLREFLDPKHKIIDPHKIILTTRHNASQVLDQYVGHHSKKVEGLEKVEVHKFITYLGRGQNNIDEIALQILEKVYEITEGNPFLVKLVITRFFDEYKPLELIISDLRKMSGHEKNLFAPSIRRFQELIGNENASRLLQAFCRSNDLLNRQILQKVSGINNNEQFDKVLSTAVRLSLIRSSELNKRFSMHSLMKAYVQNKM